MNGGDGEEYNKVMEVKIVGSEEKRTKMKSIVMKSVGGPEVLKLEEVDDPQIKDHEVLIRIAATATNLTDTYQRQGLYPVPKDASPYLGLECSGTIEAVGKNVSRWRVGDQVPT